MWTKIIESKVFTYVKTKVKTKLVGKYPGITFTTSDVTPTKPSFPNVYVQKLSGYELGKTTELGMIYGVQSVFQINISDNTSQEVAEEVAYAVADVMISLGYAMIGEPIANNTEGVFRNVARYRRNIGNEDIL